MNVPFKLKNEALDEEFLKGAKARGMVQLKGHRSVGGMRASIYNAMPIEGVRHWSRTCASSRTGMDMSMPESELRNTGAEQYRPDRAEAPAGGALPHSTRKRRIRTPSCCARRICTR